MGVKNRGLDSDRFNHYIDVVESTKVNLWGLPFLYYYTVFFIQ